MAKGNKIERRDIADDKIFDIGIDYAKSLEPAIDANEKWAKSFADIKKLALEYSQVEQQFKVSNGRKQFLASKEKEKELTEQVIVAQKEQDRTEKALITTIERKSIATESTNKKLIEERLEVNRLNKAIKEEAVLNSNTSRFLEKITVLRARAARSVQDLVAKQALGKRLSDQEQKELAESIFELFIKFSPLPELNLNDSEDDSTANPGWTAIFRHPQLVLGVMALFVYVGVEVIAGDTIGLYGQGLGVAHFGALTSYTMAFMVLGYLVGVFCIPKYLSQERALQGSAVFGLLFTLGVMFGRTDSSQLAALLFGWSGIPVVPDTVMFLALLGFANALVWPAVWPLALQGLGKLTSTGSALLIMGIAGGAILPLLYGYLAHSSGNSQLAYWMMLPCYAYILFYAFKGHKLRSWR